MEHEQMTEVVQTHRTLHAIDENKKTNANNKNKKKRKKKAKKKKHKTQPNTNPIAIGDDTLCVSPNVDTTAPINNILDDGTDISISTNNTSRDDNIIMFKDP
eukprot:831785_1